MKILYISSPDGPDYLCDMIFHGLRGLFGADVVDPNRLWYLYASEFGPGGHSLDELSGKGFTLYGLLPDLPVERQDIAAKVRSRYYDLVIFASIHRCIHYAPVVHAHYDPKDIIFLDGEDEPEILGYMGQGIYFKREQEMQVPGMYPIQFSLPAEKICPNPPKKTKILATNHPQRPETYIFDNEADYYADYQSSLFGVTVKKAGWDCLRHYELLANHCAPLFLDLAACPALTMFRYPKGDALELLQLYRQRGREYFQTQEGFQRWADAMQRIMRILRRDLTTTAMARYMLDVWTRIKQG
jgi:hypothetical protein